MIELESFKTIVFDKKDYTGGVFEVIINNNDERIRAEISLDVSQDFYDTKVEYEDILNGTFDILNDNGEYDFQYISLPSCSFNIPMDEFFERALLTPSYSLSVFSPNFIEGITTIIDLVVNVVCRRNQIEVAQRSYKFIEKVYQKGDKIEGFTPGKLKNMIYQIIETE